MSNYAANTPVTVIPTMRYADAKAAIEWLCEAFGFEKRLVVPGEGEKIAHAQLTFGNGMIMLGSAVEDDYGSLVKPPENFGGVCTQSAYIIVRDPDAVYHRAVELGAEIVMDIKDEDHGGRGFTCRDPQGQIWNFGSYDPWAVV